MLSQESKMTHFGNRNVEASLKESLVGNVFNRVSQNYDLMNDAMSLGIHRAWKHHFITLLDPQQTTKLIDVAGGTGDIAFKFLHAIKRNAKYNGHVTVVDINPSMLEQGRLKAANLGITGPHLDFLQSNAENLHQIPDSSVDAYTIAFGIRNWFLIL
jgi:2-methoxy-6-polyprenyl-1,4-benzoquinol methylase